MTIDQINERLAAIENELTTRGDSMTAEELTTLEAEVNKLKQDRAALHDSVEQRNSLLASIAEGRAANVTVTRTFPNPAAVGINAQQRNENDPLDTLEYRRAFMGYVLRGTPIPAEYRTDQTTVTTDVGAAIPTTILNKVVEKMEAVGMIVNEVTHTAYRGGVSVPTASAKPTATWVNEGAGSDKQKKALGSLTFAYHKLRCAVAVDLEVDTMALSAFETILMNNIAEAMTKTLETAIISGDGSGKPKGILAETAPSGQALESAAPSYDDLVDAEGAIPQAYEGGAKWCMSKKTFMKFIGMKDTDGQPIARVNYGIGGKPERVLLGRPVICCDYVTSYTASLAEGTVFAFLFNFKDYLLNTNYAMTVKKYEDNDTDDQVTKAIMLVDGKVVDKNSLVTLAKKA